MLAMDFQVRPFKLQREDGFIKKPKHVADLIIFLYNKGCDRL